MDNDWQRAAHVYSDEVLISHRADTEKGTPKFERGKSLSDGQQEVIYISGTAAIRGEESERPEMYFRKRKSLMKISSI